MKIHTVEAELFQANGRTDMTKMMVAFRNFANEPKTAALSDITIRKTQPQPTNKGRR